MNYIRFTDADVEKLLPGIIVNYLMAYSSSVLWVCNQTLFLHVYCTWDFFFASKLNLKFYIKIFAIVGST